MTSLLRSQTHVSDVETFDDVFHKLFHGLEIGTADRSTWIQHKHHVDADTFGAALFQLVTGVDEVIGIAGCAVVFLPVVGLRFDVTWYTAVIAASLSKYSESKN